MTLKRICYIKNNQLIIDLPDSFRGKEKVLVIVDDSVDFSTDKLALMKQAVSDPLFLADIREVSEDFGSIEHETL